MNKTAIIDKHAKRWRANARTIHRWIVDGAPLDDRNKMLAWLSSRKNIPSGTAELLAAKRKSCVSEPVAQAGPLGAGAALERLEKAESQAYARFSDAVKCGDIAAIRFTRKTWLDIGESLRKYHRQVDDVDRPGGELIERGKIENYLRGVSHWLNGGFREMGREIVELHRLRTTPPEAQELFELFSRIYLTALASALTYRCQVTIPKWVYAAMTSTSPFVAPADCVEADKIVYGERKYAFNARAH